MERRGTGEWRITGSLGFEEETWVVAVGNKIVGDRDGLACNAVLVRIVN